MLARVLRRLVGALLPAALVLTAATGLAGCGVPTGGPPQLIEATKVPYGLAAPTPSAPPTATGTPVPSAPQVYFLRKDGSLAGQGRDLPGNATASQLPALLEQLAAGPTDQEREKGLASALPPGTKLTLVSLTDGVATIEIGGEVDAPSGDGSRRAVAQLVLTATSLPGVRAVQLSRDGQPADAPLPSGALTSAPLTASDYQVLTTPSPTPTPVATTPAASAPSTPSPTPSGSAVSAGAPAAAAGRGRPRR